MKFTIESEDDGDQDKKKKRARTTTAKVLGKPSIEEILMKRKRMLHQHLRHLSLWEM